MKNHLILFLFAGTIILNSACQNKVEKTAATQQIPDTIYNKRTDTIEIFNPDSPNVTRTQIINHIDTIIK